MKPAGQPETDQIVFFLSSVTKVLFLSVCLPWLLAIPKATADSCWPTSYIRKASECKDGKREITLTKSRDCTDIITSPNQTVSCACGVGDFQADYAWDTAGEKKQCTLTFKPTGCEGGKESEPYSVAPYFCEVESKPCTADDVLYTFTKCDRTGNGTLKPTRKVIYYFDDRCNPDHVDSVELPISVDILCDLQCGAGYFLKGASCSACPAGTFSVGGGLRWDSFETLDSRYFKTKCSYYRYDGELSDCKPWDTRKGAFTVGPYDPPNFDDMDDCAQCHNNLRAELHMAVTLATDGMVIFNYTVDTDRDLEEENGDALEFYIDEVETPVLRDSFKFESQQVSFNLTVGYHVLRWVYIKDEEYTQGSDTAAITFLEVTGIELYDSACTKCSAGYYSNEAASACTPCPVDTFSNSDGAGECIACKEGTYSLEHPRVACIKRPACTLHDHATAIYGPCIMSNGRLTQKKTHTWLQPKICEEGDGMQQLLAKEEEEKCPPCPEGQRQELARETKQRICSFCPQGSRLLADEGMCDVCPNGTVAQKVLQLAHFNEQIGNLPPGMRTGCEGDCGSPGWRSVNEYLDSGVGHGQKVKVWLEYNFTLEMQGSVGLNYSVAPSPQEFYRTFDLYVDGNLVHKLLEPTMNMVEDDEDFSAVTEMRSQSVKDLGPGPHSLRFVYQNAGGGRMNSDVVQVYDIVIKSAAAGGATACVPIPPGNARVDKGSAWAPCPPGTFGPGAGSPCQNCPDNTYNTKEGNAGPCKDCEPGTSSTPGSSECFVGDATSALSVCTYEPEVSRAMRREEAANNKEVPPSILYDLSPLMSGNPHSIILPGSGGEGETGATFSISLCQKLNHSLCIYEDEPRFTYACRVDSPAGERDSPARPKFKGGEHKPKSIDLGQRVSLVPLLGPGGSSSSSLDRRGLLMKLHAEGCRANKKTMGAKDRDDGDIDMIRTIDISFICDPKAGYGKPEPWGVRTRLRVLNPSAEYPWRVDNDTAAAVQVDADKCSFSLVWFSAYACPLCGANDIVPSTLSDCPNGIRTIFHYRENQLCVPNPFEPLPPPLPCDACTANDFYELPEHCLDTEGKRNISWQWHQPKKCNDRVKGAVQLPKPKVAGPCAQVVTVSANGGVVKWTAPELVALVGGLAMGIVVLSVIAVVMCMRNQHLHATYAKLSQTAVGEFELSPGHTD